MNRCVQLPQQLDQVNKLITSTISSWRAGNDHFGLHRFLQMIEQLEQIIDQQLKINKKDQFDEMTKLIPILNHIDQRVQNCDVTGITDMLEYQLSPFIQKWHKEVQKDVE